MFLNFDLTYFRAHRHGVRYFRCSSYSETGCHATLTLSNGVHTIHGEDHNHDDMRGSVARLVFVGWCREQARTTNLAITDIYTAALRRYVYSL